MGSSQRCHRPASHALRENVADCCAAACLYDTRNYFDVRSKADISQLNLPLAYHGHIMRKQGSCLEKEITQGTMPGARRRGRPRPAWMDNIKTWTGLPVEDSVRMTENRDKWTEYVHGVANCQIEDGYKTERI